MRRCVPTVVVAGLMACSGASLPNTSGVFETIGASESTAGDGLDDEGKTSVDDDGTSTTVDPTKGEEDTTPPTSEDTTSSADASTGVITAEGGETTSGGVDEGPMSSTTTEPGMLACVDGDLGGDVGNAIAAGDSGDGDDYTLSCANGGGEDVVFTWTAPSAGSWTFDLSGSSYDTALAIVEPDCEGREIGCSDDAIGLTSMLTVDLGAGEEVLVVIDGYDGAVGSYVLDVNPAVDMSCVDEDLLDGTGASGSTAGESNSFAVGCVTGGADYAFAWIAPASGTWNFSLSGSSYDTALSIWSPDCDGSEIACNDDGPVDLTSVLDLDLEAGETIIVVIDGYMGASGSFTLAIQ